MTGDCGKPLSHRPKVWQILETAIYVRDVARAAQFPSYTEQGVNTGK